MGCGDAAGGAQGRCPTVGPTGPGSAPQDSARRWQILRDSTNHPPTGDCPSVVGSHQPLRPWEPGLPGTRGTILNPHNVKEPWGRVGDAAGAAAAWRPWAEISRTAGHAALLGPGTRKRWGPVHRALSCLREGLSGCQGPGVPSAPAVPWEPPKRHSLRWEAMGPCQPLFALVLLLPAQPCLPSHGTRR